jgi:hypothetical protein
VSVAQSSEILGAYQSLRPQKADAKAFEAGFPVAVCARFSDLRLAREGDQETGSLFNKTGLFLQMPRARARGMSFGPFSSRGLIGLR